MDNSAPPIKGLAGASLGSLLKAYGPYGLGSSNLAAPLTPARASDSLSSPASSINPGAQANAQAQGAAPALTESKVSLTSNSQFLDVLHQAIDQKPFLTPQRISIDLQTPPGATVTVFFSQVGGQIRAQLSANDSGSLQWLQQQIGGLRQSEGGPSVVWLPPQMDNPSGQSPQNGSRQDQPQNQNRPASPEGAETFTLSDSLFSDAETGVGSAN